MKVQPFTAHELQHVNVGDLVRLSERCPPAESYGFSDDEASDNGEEDDDEGGSGFF